ncbi:zinc finger and SCAN domain-containing protein 29-like [Acanthochromis polyacanthus]|uniref:zinc finger and SCAN domain-containing protein 29-like n=1 Tax=Acanthochromis polyacanthus TaxID=80966 RepID=UPI002234232D|nr:zinc finger and SCAN domain-containing protein 29-like [Acanthochromis polyacanthus]
MSSPPAEPVQPAAALVQLLQGLTAMCAEQAALHRLHCDAFRQRVERQSRVLERLLSRAGGRSASPSSSVSRLTLQKMMVADDPQSFLDMFQATAAACGWPQAEWAVRLLPLLTGEAQTAAVSLPAAARRNFADVRKAVLDRTGLSPEDHRRRFRGARLGTGERPFVFAQQVKDAATRWLLPGETAGEIRLVEKMVVEQFIKGLPGETSNWVRCHRPADLGAAVMLAEDHLAVQSGGQGRAPPVTRPTPAPRRKTLAPPTMASRFPTPPAPAPRTNLSFASPPHQAPAAADAASNPQRAPQTSGQECWRCGRPGHTRRECPRTEVGQVVRVAGTPAPSPGPD